MVNRGWLYGLMVFLAQTCNPYYSVNDTRNQYDEEIVFEDSAVDEEAMMNPNDDTFDLSQKMEVEPSRSRKREGEPPPPPPMPEEEKIFKVVEDMPRFPGCEDKGLNKSDLNKCAEDELLKFVYSNIVYPKEAMENGVEGRVILRWIVNSDGTLSDIKVLRELGAGCGKEVIRVVKLMPKFIPGKHRGKAVAVQYTFPVTFKLRKKRKRRRN